MFLKGPGADTHFLLPQQILLKNIDFVKCDFVDHKWKNGKLVSESAKVISQKSYRHTTDIGQEVPEMITGAGQFQGGPKAVSKKTKPLKLDISTINCMPIDIKSEELCNGGYFEKVTFNNCKIRSSNFNNCCLINVSFEGCVFQDVTWNVSITFVSDSGCRLSLADIFLPHQ